MVAASRPKKANYRPFGCRDVDWQKKLTAALVGHGGRPVKRTENEVQKIRDKLSKGEPMGVKDWEQLPQPARAALVGLSMVVGNLNEFTALRKAVREKKFKIAAHHVFVDKKRLWVSCERWSWMQAAMMCLKKEQDKLNGAADAAKRNALMNGGMTPEQMRAQAGGSTGQTQLPGAVPGQQVQPGQVQPGQMQPGQTQQGQMQPGQTQQQQPVMQQQQPVMQQPNPMGAAARFKRISVEQVLDDATAVLAKEVDALDRMEDNDHK